MSVLGLNDILVGFICLSLVPLVASLYLRRFGKPNEIFKASMLGQLLALVTALLYLYFEDRLLLIFRIEGRGWIAFLLTPIATVSLTSLISLLKKDMEGPLGQVVKNVRMSVLAASALILAPITEELMFRGLIQWGMTGLVGKFPALIFSSLLFALSHAKIIELKLIPLVFVQGVMLGLPVAVVQSLSPSILAHSTANLPGVLLAYRSRQRVADLTKPEEREPM